MIRVFSGIFKRSDGKCRIWGNSQKARGFPPAEWKSLAEMHSIFLHFPQAMLTVSLNQKNPNCTAMIPVVPCSASSSDRISL
jgi:hypothetical protein